MVVQHHPDKPIVLQFDQVSDTEWYWSCWCGRQNDAKHYCDKKKLFHELPPHR